MERVSIVGSLHQTFEQVECSSHHEQKTGILPVGDGFWREQLEQRLQHVDEEMDHSQTAQDLLLLHARHTVPVQRIVAHTGRHISDENAQVVQNWTSPIIPVVCWWTDVVGQQ